MSTWAGPLIAPSVGTGVPAAAVEAATAVGEAVTAGVVAIVPVEVVAVATTPETVVSTGEPGVLGASELHAPTVTRPAAINVATTPLRIGRGYATM